MRWYSIKDYVPPRDCTLFAASSGGYFYCGIYHGADGWEWELDDVDDKTEIDITHFCIPEPVEREE